MSNVISSYESILGLIKKFYQPTLSLVYVPLQYNDILKNLLGELLSMPKFAYIESLELLTEPIVVHKSASNILVFFSLPFLAHFFNQPLVLSNNPIEFIHDTDPIQNLMSVAILPSKSSNSDLPIVYNTKSNQFFGQFTTSNQRYVMIQMMRMVLLGVHVQQHYLNKNATLSNNVTDHSYFRKLERAKRIPELPIMPFYEYDSDDDGTDDD